MLETAFAIQDVAKKTLWSQDVMGIAGHIVMEHETMDGDEIAGALSELVLMATSMATALLTELLMTEEQVAELSDTIEELTAMMSDAEENN